MDGQKTGTAVNGAKKTTDSKQSENEAKEKVNKTLLLRQQIEENRLRMQQREKEISNSKKNLEQLFTQLDRSASGMSLNMSVDVEDVRDTKIASLESSLAALKSEKKEMELQLLSLESIQEAKEGLELEISGLRSSYDHLSAENQILQARTQKFHALEDENDELKLRIDRLAYENSGLKEDLGARDHAIQLYEAKISKLNKDFDDISSKNAAVEKTSTLIEQLEEQLHQISSERNLLHSECEDLKKRLSESLTATPAAASPEVKVSTLGSKKKPKAKRGKAEQSTNDEVKTEDTSAFESQIALLTTQRDALEGDNATLKSSIATLEEKLVETDTERRTLQQRVELLMAELSSEANSYNNSNDLANLQMLVQEKEAAYTSLAGQLDVLHAENGEIVQQLQKAEKEVFELKAKCRDVEYTVQNKEETIRELQQRLSVQSEQPPTVEPLPVEAPQPAVKISNIGAGKKSRSRGRGGRTATEVKPSTGQEDSSSAQSQEQISTLNSKIAVLEQEIVSLNEKNARLTVVENQLMVLEERLAENEEEKRTLQKRIDLLLSELDSNDGRDEIASLQNLLQSKGEEYAKLLAKLEDDESGRSDSVQKLNEAESELFKLRAQQRDTQYVLASKDDSINELQQKLDAAFIEMEQLKEVIADLESKLLAKESSQEDEEKSASSTVSHLQDALREARQELANMESELTDRSEVLQRLEKSCTALSKETSEKNVEILRLKEDLQDAEVVLAEKDAKLKMVQDELNQMKIRADDDSNVSAWETQLNHSQMEREIMRNDLETRSSQLNECKDVCSNLESQLEEAKTREIELVASSETANAQRVVAEEKLGQLSDKFKKLAANYKQKLQVIQQLEAKMEKVKEAASQGGEPEQLQLRVAETEAEIRQLQEQLAKMQDTAAQLAQARQTLEQKENELRMGQESSQQVMEENKKLAEQLEQLRNATDELEQARTALGKAESTVHSMQMEVQQSTDENRKLYERLEELQAAVVDIEQLQSTLHFAQRDITALQEQYHFSQNEVSRLSEENRGLVEQLTRNNESKDAADQLILYQEHVKRLESELQSVQSQMQLTTEQNGQLSHQLQQTADTAQHLEQLKIALHRTEGELAVSQNQLGEVQQEVQQMAEESRKLMEQLTVASDRVYQLQSQLEQQQNQSEIHSEETERRIRSMTEEHSSAMESLQYELTTIRDQLHSVSSSFQDEGSARSQLEERLRTSENEVAMLRSEMADTLQLKDRLLQESDGLRRRVEELQADLASSSQSSDVMQNQLADLWEEKQQVLNRNAHLEDELNRMQRQLEERSSSTDLEKELQEVRDQLAAAQWDLDTKTNELSSVQQLRDQLSAIQWELDTKAGQLIDLEQQRHGDSEKIAQLEGRCADLDAWIESNTGDVPGLRSRIQELENQLADLNNQYSGLYSTYGTKLFEMTTLENQLADANLKVTQLKDESTHHQDSIDQWSAKISLIETANADLLGQVDQLKNDLEQAGDVKNRMEVLNQELETLRSAYEEQLRLIQEKESSLGQLRVELDGLASEKNSLLEEISRRDSDVEGLKRELSVMEEQARQLKANASDVQEIGLLRMNLADLTSERDDLQYQMEDVQAQCSTLETKITEAEEVRSILETTVSYLESKVSELQSELAVIAAGREEDQSMHSAQLAAMTQERDGLAAEFANAQQQNQELLSLRLTLDEAERMLKESDAALVASRLCQVEASSRTEETERQLADALRCLSEEQQKCRSILDQREELEQQLNQVHQANQEDQAKLLDQVNQLQQELNRLQDIAQLCDQYKAEVEEARRIHSQVDDWKNQAEEVSQLRVKLFEALTDKDELESNVQTLEEELAAVQAQLDRDQRQSSTELDDVRKELEDNRIASNQLVIVQEELEEARMELAAANRRSATALADLQSQLEAERSTGQATAFELNARCADMDMERSLLMAKCMELQDLQAVLEAKCAELEQFRSEAVLEKERLESELANQSSSSSHQTTAMSESSLNELAQLRLAVMDMTSEKEELEEKLAEAEEKLSELSSLRITNSELSMELEEAQARVQVAEEEKESQVTDIKRQLAEYVAKLNQQQERIDRVSVERDELQQTVSRMSEVHLGSEKSESEGQEKTTEEQLGDVTALRKQITGLESDLHDAKIKAAKSIRQVKLLRAELAKEKEAANAAAAAPPAKPSGGDDYFNFAVEEELRKQIGDAEKATAEKVKEIERLLARIDTLESASERFMQAKERQDNEMAMLQQRNRELLSQIKSLEWDHSETTPNVKERVPEESQARTATLVDDDERISALETTISQLTDDNENYQDMLDELKTERQAMEAQFKERIAALELDITEKSRLLDQVSQQVENKERLLSDAYDSVSQLRQQVKQLAESGSGESGSTLLDELRRENENLVDMIRQLSTTGTLDAATVQRLKEEIDQAAGEDRFQQSSDLGDGSIDWQSGFNDLQIEVEYLRSQNAALLNRLQEAGLVWDDGTELVNEDNDRIELLRLQLDDAIRNVHERDMRCQELTWEITKLLEERDTLQLRLSNSLRQNHEMQQELKDFSATASGASPMGDIATKLRELKQLNYSLDVQLRREQEERQTIERQLMALYGSRGGSTSPIYANGSRRLTGRHQEADGSGMDLNNSQELANTGEVLSEWLKGKESSDDVQHI